MADGTTPWMSYALMVGVAVGGSLIIRRMIVSFNAQNQSTEESTPLQSALAEGRHADAGRLLMEAGDFEAAARKFVQAGRVLDAARAFRKAERWDKADQVVSPHLFEEAKDYASAAQCYRRLGRLRQRCAHHTAQANATERRH
jgi:tetratricopeptide (TPR) repeat protein